jgi:RHS repeat-associated protein
VDGLGSTRLLTDDQGAVLNAYRYDAFGNTTDQTGTTDNKYQFAGEQFDAAMSDYYLRQRFYDTSSGRFGRMDTYEGRQSEPLTLHKYLYANGNPGNGTDPTGLMTIADLISADEVFAILASIKTFDVITNSYNPERLGGFNEGNRPPTILESIFAWRNTWTPEPLGGFGAGSSPSFPSHTGRSIGDIDDFAVFVFPYDTVPLIRNMKAVSRYLPANYAAHHIIAGKHQSFDEARIVLAGKGIDLQEEVNGAILYNKTGYYNSHQGRGLHSRNAANKIIERIEDLTSDEAREELRKGSVLLLRERNRAVQLTIQISAAMSQHLRHMGFLPPRTDNLSALVNQLHPKLHAA